jgi:hypothetical protein
MSANVLEPIRENARRLGRKIVLTESDDIRNLKAAAKLVQTGYAKPVLVGDAAAIRSLAAEGGVDLVGVDVVDVLSSPRLDSYIATIVDLRRSKGLTPEQAREWIKDTCVFAAAMVCVGDEPRVGMISCSTRGSAKDPTVDKVIEATRKAQAMAPDLLIDGEFAAVIPEIGAKKAPGSKIAGRGNVRVFPDLNAVSASTIPHRIPRSPAAFGPDPGDVLRARDRRRVRTVAGGHRMSNQMPWRGNTVARTRSTTFAMASSTPARKPASESRTRSRRPPNQSVFSIITPPIIMPRSS